VRKAAARQLRNWRRPPAGKVPELLGEEAMRAMRRAARWLLFGSIEAASQAGWSEIMLLEAAAELER
jgi:hypothetical protein